MTEEYTKQCSKCKKKKSVNEFYQKSGGKYGVDSICKYCRIQMTKKYCQKNREKTKQYLKQWHQKNPDYGKKRTQKVRLKILIHYSGDPPKCMCCGEKHVEFLSIDHINGDGARHRQKLGGSSFYEWIVKNNFPLGLQILCYNCNCAKGFLGYCPHKRKK